MFVCQWHLDVPYGKQGEALAAMRTWGAEKFVYRVLDESPG
jgi:hypothetical protein